jgi:hypothetical protein
MVVVKQTKSATGTSDYKKLVGLFHPIFTESLETGELYLDMEGAFAHIIIRPLESGPPFAISKQRKQYPDNVKLQSVHIPE